ncbi:LysR substrate-binding domain-containing protein [Pandoraea pnomenusa]|uniref:LysR substrate-binding domain-containing protein n=1 Tax=Pandoraea pnomenusa TaxID=93220 RepID=UPI003CEF4D1F
MPSGADRARARFHARRYVKAAHAALFLSLVARLAGCGRLAAARATRGPIFDDSGLLLRAALAGQGVATTRSLLVRDALASGELVQIGDIQVPPSLEYYVSWRENHPRERSIHAFWQWMQAQIAATTPQVPPPIGGAGMDTATPGTPTRPAR